MHQSLFCFWSSLFCSVRDLYCKIFLGKWIKKKWPGLESGHVWLGSNWKSHPASSLELISGSGRGVCLYESSGFACNSHAGCPRSFASPPGSSLRQPCAVPCRMWGCEPPAPGTMKCYQEEQGHPVLFWAAQELGLPVLCQAEESILPPDAQHHVEMCLCVQLPARILPKGHRRKLGAKVAEGCQLDFCSRVHTEYLLSLIPYRWTVIL